MQGRVRATWMRGVNIRIRFVDKDIFYDIHSIMEENEVEHTREHERGGSCKDHYMREFTGVFYLCILYYRVDEDTSRER